MNTAFWRLTWKEYRSIRTFWLSIVGLVFLLSWVFVLTQERATAINLVFNFALGAPAFFAIGCAGAAFAGEKEEGTFEFLRGSPVSSGQILASKLLLTAIATLAMYAVLWPLALLATGSHLPEPTQLPGMLGLWLVGAIEAIAWGTLFSLLGARPLLAVVLAMAAASTFAHSLSWGFRQSSNYGFEWMSYLRAAPWRALIALAVLGVDIYLGRHWLDSALPISKRRRSLWSSRIAADDPALARALLVRRSRGAMLGRLLWQHIRQSGWLMLLMAVLFVFLGGQVGTAITAGGAIRLGDVNTPWPMAVLASLIGSMVFLADQEQRRYRFFAEHNTPPRYVWLARQIPWMLTLSVSTLVVCIFWLKTSNFKYLWELIEAATGEHEWRWPYPWAPRIQVPSFGIGLAFVAVAYSAGQWMSMFIRSGIMAGFLGVVLSFLLCAWTVLMHNMRLSFLWTVLPIPIVLLAATWLRAPDWISENRRRSARVRAAATVLAPVLLLAVAIPIYRVNQIPILEPQINTAEIKAAVDASREAAAKAVELYREASDKYVAVPGPSDDRERDREEKLYDKRVMTPWQKQLLTENAEALALVLKADQFVGSATLDPGAVRYRYDLVRLVVVDGRRLEGEGKLNEALERYFTALRVETQLADLGDLNDSLGVLSELTHWAAQKGQTPQRVRPALGRLKEFGVAELRLQERINANYALTRRFLLGDKDALQPFYGRIGRGSISSEAIWLAFIPGEAVRAMRLLDVLTQVALWRLEDMQLVLKTQGRAFEANNGRRTDPKLGLGGALPTDWNWTSLNIGWSDRFGIYLRDVLRVSGTRPHDGVSGDQLATWLDSTVPYLWFYSNRNDLAAMQMVSFEAQRRGTMLVLAIQAYRLEHGNLPKSLEEVMDADFDRWPLDPFSGLEFRYFPRGLPVDELSQAVVAATDTAADISPQEPRESSRWGGLPGVWCTRPSIIAEKSEERIERPDGTLTYLPVWYYQNAVYGYYNTGGDIWSQGLFFPIPAQN
jgi:hypothetical protein